MSTTFRCTLRTALLEFVLAVDFKQRISSRRQPHHERLLLALVPVIDFLMNLIEKYCHLQQACHESWPMHLDHISGLTIVTWTSRKPLILSAWAAHSLFFAFLRGTIITSLFVEFGMDVFSRPIQVSTGLRMVTLPQGQRIFKAEEARFHTRVTIHDDGANNYPHFLTRAHSWNGK